MNQPAAISEDANLNELITEILEIKENEKTLSDQGKALKKDREALEYRVLGMMQELGLERTGIGAANVIIVHKKFAQVDDWDAFTPFVHKNNALYLMQRRLSQKAVEEFAAQGEEIPGIAYYEEDQLSVRKR
jgi:hypothetical protein